MALAAVLAAAQKVSSLSFGSSKTFWLVLFSCFRLCQSAHLGAKGGARRRGADAGDGHGDAWRVCAGGSFMLGDGRSSARVENGVGGRKEESWPADLAFL